MVGPCSLQEAELEKNSEDDTAMQSLRGVWLLGSREGTTYNGIDAQALPTIRLQVTGGNMLIACSALEASTFWRTESLQDIRRHMQALQAKDVPDELAMPSLGAVFLRTGDVLVLPGGYLLLEKAVHDTDVALRLAWLVRLSKVGLAGTRSNRIDACLPHSAGSSGCTCQTSATPPCEWWPTRPTLLKTRCFSASGN